MKNPLRQLLRPKSAGDFTAQIVAKGEIKTALDIGCGTSSHLQVFRPTLETTGLDAFTGAIDISKKYRVHDHYIHADILKDKIDTQFDLVTLYGLIEHLPKTDGIKLLDRVEKLSRKYIIFETPNGFVPQGPEFGNEFQRHLSGWNIQEFINRGYKVYGTTGTRYLRGYMAGPKYNFPGCIFFDELITLLLRINNNPKHAFNLVAIKDLHGISAKHKKEDQH
jgi:SAM-dependent methyltransferase